MSNSTPERLNAERALKAGDIAALLGKVIQFEVESKKPEKKYWRVACGQWTDEGPSGTAYMFPAKLSGRTKGDPIVWSVRFEKNFDTRAKGKTTLALDKITFHKPLEFRHWFPAEDTNFDRAGGGNEAQARIEWKKFLCEVWQLACDGEELPEYDTAITKPTSKKRAATVATAKEDAVEADDGGGEDVEKRYRQAFYAKFPELLTAKSIWDAYDMDTEQGKLFDLSKASESDAHMISTSWTEHVSLANCRGPDKTTLLEARREKRNHDVDLCSNTMHFNAWQMRELDAPGTTNFINMPPEGGWGPMEDRYSKQDKGRKTPTELPKIAGGSGKLPAQRLDSAGPLDLSSYSPFISGKPGAKSARDMMTEEQMQKLQKLVPAVSEMLDWQAANKK